MLKFLLICLGPVLYSLYRGKVRGGRVGSGPKQKEENCFFIHPFSGSMRIDALGLVPGSPFSGSVKTDALGWVQCLLNSEGVLCTDCESSFIGQQDPVKASGFKTINFQIKGLVSTCQKSEEEVV